MAVPRRAGVFFIVLTLVASGCAVRGLAFTQDDRLKIVEPANHTKQLLPVSFRWTITGFSVTGPTPSATKDAGYFAVFLDRAPPAPGQTLAALAKGDRQCKAYEGCPDPQWYSSHDIFPTTSLEFTVDTLPLFNKADREFVHELTVVLLDGTGHRIGETAASVEFRVTGKRQP